MTDQLSVVDAFITGLCGATASTKDFSSQDPFRHSGSQKRCVLKFQSRPAFIMFYGISQDDPAILAALVIGHFSILRAHEIPATWAGKMMVDPSSVLLDLVDEHLQNESRQGLPGTCTSSPH
jgi:hypothetical protein